MPLYILWTIIEVGLFCLFFRARKRTIANIIGLVICLVLIAMSITTWQNNEEFILEYKEKLIVLPIMISAILFALTYLKRETNSQFQPK